MKQKRFFSFFSLVKRSVLHLFCLGVLLWLGVGESFGQYIEASNPESEFKILSTFLRNYRNIPTDVSRYNKSGSIVYDERVFHLRKKGTTINYKNLLIPYSKITVSPGSGYIFSDEKFNFSSETHKNNQRIMLLDVTSKINKNKIIDIRFAGPESKRRVDKGDGLPRINDFINFGDITSTLNGKNKHVSLLFSPITELAPDGYNIFLSKLNDEAVDRIGFSWENKSHSGNGHCYIGWKFQTFNSGGCEEFFENLCGNLTNNATSIIQCTKNTANGTKTPVIHIWEGYEKASMNYENSSHIGGTYTYVKFAIADVDKISLESQPEKLSSNSYVVREVPMNIVFDFPSVGQYLPDDEVAGNDASFWIGNTKIGDKGATQFTIPAGFDIWSKHVRTEGNKEVFRFPILYKCTGEEYLGLEVPIYVELTTGSKMRPITLNTNLMIKTEDKKYLTDLTFTMDNLLPPNYANYEIVMVEGKYTLATNKTDNVITLTQVENSNPALEETVKFQFKYKVSEGAYLLSEVQEIKVVNVKSNFVQHIKNMFVNHSLAKAKFYPFRKLQSNEVSEDVNKITMQQLFNEFEYIPIKNNDDSIVHRERLKYYLNAAQYQSTDEQNHKFTLTFKMDPLDGAGNIVSNPTNCIISNNNTVNNIKNATIQFSGLTTNVVYFRITPTITRVNEYSDKVYSTLDTLAVYIKVATAPELKSLQLSHSRMVKVDRDKYLDELRFTADNIFPGVANYSVEMVESNPKYKITNDNGKLVVKQNVIDVNVNERIAFRFKYNNLGLYPAEYVSEVHYIDVVNAKANFVEDIKNVFVNNTLNRARSYPFRKFADELPTDANTISMRKIFDELQYQSFENNNLGITNKEDFNTFVERLKYYLHASQYQSDTETDHQFTLTFKVEPLNSTGGVMTITGASNCSLDNFSLSEGHLLGNISNAAIRFTGLTTDIKYFRITPIITRVNEYADHIYSTEDLLGMYIAVNPTCDDLNGFEFALPSTTLGVLGVTQFCKNDGNTDLETQLDMKEYYLKQLTGVSKEKMTSLFNDYEEWLITMKIRKEGVTQSGENDRNTVTRTNNMSSTGGEYTVFLSSLTDSINSGVAKFYVTVKNKRIGCQYPVVIERNIRFVNHYPNNTATSNEAPNLIINQTDPAYCYPAIDLKTSAEVLNNISTIRPTPTYVWSVLEDNVLQTTTLPNVKDVTFTIPADSRVKQYTFLQFRKYSNGCQTKDTVKITIDNRNLVAPTVTAAGNVTTSDRLELTFPSSFGLERVDSVLLEWIETDNVTVKRVIRVGNPNKFTVSGDKIIFNNNMGNVYFNRVTLVALNRVNRGIDCRRVSTAVMNAIHGNINLFRHPNWDFNADQTTNFICKDNFPDSRSVDLKELWGTNSVSDNAAVLPTSGVITYKLCNLDDTEVPTNDSNFPVNSKGFYIDQATGTLKIKQGVTATTLKLKITYKDDFGNDNFLDNFEKVFYFSNYSLMKPVLVTNPANGVNCTIGSDVAFTVNGSSINSELGGAMSYYWYRDWETALNKNTSTGTTPRLSVETTAAHTQYIANVTSRYQIGTSANQFCSSVASDNSVIKNSGLSSNFQITGHNLVNSGTPRIELWIDGDTINVTKNLVEITQTYWVSNTSSSDQYKDITPSITVATGLTSSISTALLTIKGIKDQSSNGVKLRFSTLGCSSDVILQHKATPAKTAFVYEKVTRSSLAPIAPQEPETTIPEVPAIPNTPEIDTTCGNVDILKCRIYNEYIAQLSRGEVRSMLLPTVVSREATLELSTYSPIEGELKVDVYSTSGVYQGTVYFYAYKGSNTYVIQKNLLPQRSEHFFVIIRHSDNFVETLKGLQL